MEEELLAAADGEEIGFHVESHEFKSRIQGTLFLLIRFINRFDEHKIGIYHHIHKERL
jgi:hypothetical protein